MRCFFTGSRKSGHYPPSEHALPSSSTATGDSPQNSPKMLTSKRYTASCFLLGALVGVVLSPVMWLTLSDPFSDSSSYKLCAGAAGGEKAAGGRGEAAAGGRGEGREGGTLPLQAWAVNGEAFERKLKRENGKEVLGHLFGQYGKNKFNLSSESPVTAEGDPAHRYKKLERELAPRKLLFVGVVSAAKYLGTRGVAINNTWGRGLTDMYFFSSRGNNTSNRKQQQQQQQQQQELQLPVITLPGVNDSTYPPQRKVYRMLKYMHDHFIEEYDFFMRSDDDVYFKMDLLLELLGGVNPAQELYMGSPGMGKAEDKGRIQLSEGEHYCMGGPGVIFSRSALRRLAPHLESCLKSVVVSYNEDVEVGRCVSKKLDLQCTWSWEANTLFWTDYKRILATPDLYTSPSVERAISLHPIKDPKLMYRVHQYAQELRLRRVMGEVAGLQRDIQRISRLVPRNMQHFKQNRWLWYGVGTNPTSRYKLSVWEYFNSSQLFQSYEHLPVLSLPEDTTRGINTALETLIDHMNNNNNNNNNNDRATKPVFLPPYHLFDGYVLRDYSSGILYRLHLSVHHRLRAKAPVPVQYQAEVFLPLQGAGMAAYEEVQPRSQRVAAHLIVNAGKTSDLRAFLETYERVCIANSLRTHLHVVLFGSEGQARAQVAKLVARHPRELVSSYEVMEGAPFSHSRGYRHVAKRLSADDLLVLFDHNFAFTEEFILHVQMHAVKGRQAYFPMAFTFYKPEVVRRFTKAASLRRAIVSADTGFFLRYNYQVVAIFKSDYDLVNSVSLATAGGEGGGGGVRNDDVRFVDKALASDIYVMRGLEPYLRRRYLHRTCKLASSGAQTACLNSKVDAIGSKKMLGAMLISHNLLDSV